MGVDEFLESHDLSHTDIAPFLLIHTILSAALVGSTWWWCYWGSGRPAPSQIMSKNKQIPQSMLLNSLLATPMISDGIKRRATQSFLALEKASRNSKPVKYIEQKIPSLDATRLCVSFAEAKFGRLFFKPITVPGRIWLSWKGAKMWKRMKSSIGSGSDGNGTCTTAYQHGSDVPLKNRGRQKYDSIAVRPKDDSIFLRECRDFSCIQRAKMRINTGHIDSALK